MVSSELLVLLLDLAGTIAFAVYGALSAIRYTRLDLVGVLVLGSVTAMGGGAMRDAILGVTPDMPMEEIRAAWRRQVRESHPDRMQARGVPAEAVKLAEKRIIDINRAWEEISERV